MAMMFWKSWSCCILSGAGRCERLRSQLVVIQGRGTQTMSEERGRGHSERFLKGKKRTLCTFGFREQGWEESQHSLPCLLNWDEETELSMVAIWPLGKCIYSWSRYDEFSLESLSLNLSNLFNYLFTVFSDALQVLWGLKTFLSW